MTDDASVGRAAPAAPGVLWAASGAQWLTSPGVGVPTRLVATVVALTDRLDRRGAGLAELFGARGLGVLGERAAVLGLGPSGTQSCGGATRLLACRDGWVALSLARPDDVATVPAWLDVDPGLVTDDDPWSLVECGVAAFAVADLVERAGLLGLACSAVGEVDDARPVLAEQVGEAAATPLAGLVVANLGSLWAGPLAADALARLGARVITVESTARPDGSRVTPAFFDALHGRCESVALPLHTEAGRRRLGALLGAVDIVIEGSRPRALEQMAIDARALAGVGPRIWLSITGHGRGAPHAHRVGFGDDAAAAGGLVAWVAGQPRFVADAVADPLTGLVAAATVADLAERGGRWLVDVALSRVAASVAPGSGGGWSAALDEGVPPRRRSAAGRALPLGRDTARVLAEFGVGA